MKNKPTLLLVLITVLIASLACSLGGAASDAGEAPAAEEAAPESQPAEEAAPAEAAEEEALAEEAAPASSEYDTVFPLPDDVQNFTGGGEQVNFAASLTVEESIEFYRSAFADMGLTERELNTAITDTTFSMVFDGYENGQALVIQGVDLGNGTTNINIRFEDI